MSYRHYYVLDITSQLSTWALHLVTKDLASVFSKEFGTGACTYMEVGR